ncbi:MAG TPA: CDP-alcohol phosphatidyltransferase family protein [Gemmatimonadales bacterium]|nr:CDP-alcohol phosphatidyltransferase family protein [Gemmatimonadales bacterium]
MKRWVTPVDALTGLRVPLAIVFPFLHRPAIQLGVVALAAASDVLDGILARRVGGSRMGVVLDPVADKVFMVSAFLTVGSRGVLPPLEVLGVLARDVVAVLGSLVRWTLHRPVALPARAGGKVVTVAQMTTLVAAVVLSPLVRPLAWATTAVGLYAIWDYARAITRLPPSPAPENET